MSIKFYLKTIRNRIDKNDLLRIKTGKSILEKKFGNHNKYLESLYIELENSYANCKENLPIFHENEKINKTILSQYFSREFNNFRFTNTILYSIASKKKISLPIPAFWYPYFEKYDLQISKQGSCFLYLSQGLIRVLFCIKTFFKVFKKSIFKNKKNYDNFFYNLSHLNFPYDCNFADFTLYSELIRNKIIYKNQNSLIYVKNKRERYKINQKNSQGLVDTTDISFIFFIERIKLIFLFYIFFEKLFISIYYLLKKRLEYLNLIEEIYNNEIVKISNFEKLPRKIFYNNSSWKYKPLWTYQAENRGLKVIVFFYSLSEHEYKLKNFQTKLLQGQYNLFWNNYLYWNNQHRLFLENISKVSPNFQFSGPLSFRDTDNKIDTHIDFSKSIAVFIAAPYKKIFSNSFAMFSSEYRSIDNMVKFLNDIYLVSKKYNLNIIMKPKKTDNTQISKLFYSRTKNVFKDKNTNLIDENISPKKFVDGCLCSISFPFSSTAFLVKKSENSIFFDPTSKLDINDKASSGIKVINSIIELDKYITSRIDK